MKQYEEIKITGYMRIPTTGMRLSEKHGSLSIYDTDCNQLHFPYPWAETLGFETAPVAFIEIDGFGEVVMPATGSIYDAVKCFHQGVCMHEHMREHKATAIVTRIPLTDWRFFTGENGAAQFIARHHPEQTVRVAMIAKLMEVYGAPQPGEDSKARVLKLMRQAG